MFECPCRSLNDGRHFEPVTLLVNTTKHCECCVISYKSFSSCPWKLITANYFHCIPICALDAASAIFPFNPDGDI